MRRRTSSTPSSSEAIGVVGAIGQGETGVVARRQPHQWGSSRLGELNQADVEAARMGVEPGNRVLGACRTLSLLAGVPLHVVSRRLGHANQAFTARVYGHVLPQQAADAVVRFAVLVDDDGPDEAREEEEGWAMPNTIPACPVDVGDRVSTPADTVGVLQHVR